MSPGDLVAYRNPYRPGPPALGIITSLDRVKGTADLCFYTVLFTDGTSRLITESYLELVNSVGGVE